MPHSVRDHSQLWLEYAKADLALARVPLPVDSKYELLLFHAQQAVEKSFKAVLTLYEIDFPYTHNLQRLVELIPDVLNQRDLLIAATPLTEYAVITRYPGEIEPVQAERYQRLLRLAERVYAWAITVLETVDKENL
jgi:HEPN domain-containing protein